MGAERRWPVRRVLWVVALPVWLAGVAMIVFGDRTTGFELAGFSGLVLFTLLVTRLEDSDAQPNHSPPL